MRTLFWCCCAMAVTAASLAYLAADHAYRYPESVVGRCTHLAYRVATDCNPAVRFGQVVSRCACEASREVMTFATSKGAKACCAPTACQQACPETNDQAPASGESPVDIIDLANYQIPLQSEPDQSASDDQTPKTFPLPINHDCVSGIDDNIGSECEPIDGSKDSSCVPLQKPESETPETPCQPSSDIGEDNGVPPACTIEKKDDVKSDDAEAELQDWLKQYEEAGIEPKVEPEKAVKPQGDHEESETINEGEPPTCQEDPNNDHQYPGCPYMGGCPRSGHCPAVQVDPAPVTPKKTKKHKTKQAEPKPEAAKPVVPEVESGSEEQEPQTEVDTMEYRKSDAKKDEFKQKPF